jgi:hypothetical protein
VTLLCKEMTVAKSEEVKTGSNLAQSCKAGYCSKRAVDCDNDGHNKQRLFHNEITNLILNILHMNLTLQRIK